MNCFMCKGHIEDKLTTFMVDVDNNASMGGNIIIVKNVPSQVCRQCGEVSYSNDVAVQLEIIVKACTTNITEIAVVNYSDKVVA